MKTIKLEDIKNGDAVIDMGGRRILIIDNILDFNGSHMQAEGSMIIMQDKRAVLDDKYTLASKVVKIEPKDDYIKDVIKFIFEKSNR